MSQTPSSERVAAARTLTGGVLMGLANLVPGISGGTMILAVGLYDRFIGAVADVTRLRLSRDTILFLVLIASGLGVAVLTFSGVAVALVNDHRWIMYSLFIGLTMGGVPELSRLADLRSPGRGAVALSILVGLAGMALLTFSLSGTQLPQHAVVLVVVGAAAASSMILPGISGSYILLILGMYDVVLSSLSLGALREDFGECARIVVPFVLGAVAGIALLSNLLKWLLAKHSRASHGVLLGLLCGSVFGLFPFQDPVHPDLADKRLRKATVMLLAGEQPDAVRERLGSDLGDGLLEKLALRHEGKTPGQLKAEGEELEFFTPGAGQVAGALGLLLVGFLLTRLVGRGSVHSKGDPHG